MPINFDALPSATPNNLPDEGQYLAKITKAEMKIGKQSNNPYLNVELSLSKNGKGFGKIFDIITESDSDIQRFKLRRLIEALGIPMHGNFELKDLAKIITGKSLLVDVTHEKPKDGQRERAIVDVFKSMIYYPLTEAEGSNEYTETPVDDDDLPFDASDADDADNAGADTTEY